MKIILKSTIIMLLPSLALATRIVSQQAGNAKDTATWVGGVVPGIGDEVSLFHTVSATDTWTFGTSPSSGSFALNLNSTGTLHITSTGKVFQRGYCIYTAGAGNTTDAVDVDGGGDWAFDASASTSPTTLHYGCYPNGTSGYRKFKISGSSSAYATVYNVVASTIAILGQNSQGNGGVYQLHYSSAVRVAWEIAYNNGGSAPTKWDATNSSFTNCGLINANAGGNMESSSTFKHEYNWHQGSWGDTIFAMNIYSLKDTFGTRSIKGNVFDVKMTSNLGLGDFSVLDNFMGAGYDSGISSFSILNNNFIRMTQANVTTGANGIMVDDYAWWDDDQQNAHYFNTGISSGSSMVGFIVGMSGRARVSGADDSGEFWLPGGPGRISTTSITNTIFLGNGSGYQSVQATSLIGTSNPFTYLNNRFILNHNTYFGGWDNSHTALPPFAMLDHSETSNMAPGTIDSFRDNLLFNPMVVDRPAQFFKTLDVGNANGNLAVGYGTGPTTDVCAPSRCDYNGAFVALSTGAGTNTAAYTNQGKGYVGKFSATPGAHDVDGEDPSFTDYKRNVELFDSKYWRPYFGLSQPTAWSSGASYAQGDIVSHSSSTYYWGESINYVYIDTGVCGGSNPEPGVIPLRSWNKCWKFQSIEDLKQAVASSMTFTDATIGASGDSGNRTLIKWIRTGFAPTNTAYQGTAHDGGDIGAVPVLPPPTDPLDLSFFPSVDQTASHYSTAFGTITVTDSLYKVFRSSQPNAAMNHWYIGYQMRNEFQGIQVHIRPTTNMPSVNVFMSNLVSSNSTPSYTIAASTPDIVIYKEYYLNVSTPSCLSTSTFMGGARDYMPDPLIPKVDPYWQQTTNAFPVAILSTQTQTAWIDVHIPTAAPSGYYSGSIYVASGSVVVSTLPVVIGVWNWVMPSTATMAMAGGGFEGNGMRNVSYGASDAAVQAYPNTRGSANSADAETWVDGTTQLLDNRYTAYSLDKYFPGDTPSKWSDFMTDYAPLLNGTPTHASSSHPISTILPGAKMTMFRMNILNQASITSFKAGNWNQWVSTFTNQGWIDTLTYKLVDEPSASQWGTVTTSGTTTRTLSTPIVPNLVTSDLSDAIATVSSGAYVVDYITPLMSQVDTRTIGDLRSTYNNYLTLSSGTVRKIGSYIDCVQGGTCANGTIGASTTPPWPNRMVDGTPVANRAMETWMYLDDIDFELYFAVNFCESHLGIHDTQGCPDSSPWTTVYAFGNQGDGTIIYASTGSVVSVSTPIWCPSMRLKYFRDGEQDYEYEHYLTQQGSGTFVSAQVATWMTGGHSFSNDPAGIRAARLAMGNAIHDLSFANTLIPAITSDGTASGQIGITFNFQIIATHSPTNYSATNIPPGLTLDASTGFISGVPLTEGIYVMDVTASNASGDDTETLSITVNPATAGVSVTIE